MKKNLLILVVALLVCMLPLTAYAAEFTDVNGHWAKSYIDRWSNEKVVNGYQDNTFKPNNYITRAEFIAMVMRVFEPIQKADLSKYSDVASSAWYYDSLSKAVAMGAIKGDSDTSIRPEDYITRQEAIVILNRILGIINNSNDVKFSDANKIAEWAKSAILAFTENEYVNGYEDGSIKPTAYITRAEITKILDKAIGKIVSATGEINVAGITGSIVVKAENVTLTNDENVEKVFAYSNSVKNTLKTSRVVVVINENANSTTNNIEKEDDKGGSESGGGNGGQVSSKSFILTLKPTSNKYEVIKDGELKDGSKFTLVVNENKILENEEFSRNNFFQFKLDLMSALEKAKTDKTLDAKKLLATVQEVKDNSIITTDDVLNSLSDDDKALLQEILGDSDDDSLSEIAKKLSNDDIVTLGTIFLDMDYDTFKSLIDKL